VSIFETQTLNQPTPEQAALRAKRALAQAFHQIEIALSQVHQLIERHGKSEIDQALGEDRAEVARLYKELKSIVEKNKPDARIPEYS
jgi:hypothetical protein